MQHVFTNQPTAESFRETQQIQEVQAKQKSCSICTHAIFQIAYCQNTYSAKRTTPNFSKVLKVLVKHENAGRPFKLSSQ
jgi:hypothetical protein